MVARPLSAVAPLSKAAYSPGYADQEQSIGKLAMVMKTAEQAMENMEYVRRLLRQKQPGFAASLELAASQLERKLREPVIWWTDWMTEERSGRCSRAADRE